MAMPGPSFIAALVRYGRRSTENREKIEAWYEEAVLAIADNQGADIVNGSGNGVAFAKQISMTNTEWFTVLDRVINHLDAGTLPSSRSLARFL